MSSLYISEAFLCPSDFSVLFGEFEIQPYTGRVIPKKAQFGLVKEINKKGSSIIPTWVTSVFTVSEIMCVCVCVLCVLTGVPAKGAWSQFSCQKRLRLSTKSWKNGWVLLKTEKPTMLTRWSATSSSRSKENSCRAKWERGRGRETERDYWVNAADLDGSCHILLSSTVIYFK